MFLYEMTPHAGYPECDSRNIACQISPLGGSVVESWLNHLSVLIFHVLLSIMTYDETAEQKGKGTYWLRTFRTLLTRYACLTATRDGPIGDQCDGTVTSIMSLNLNCHMLRLHPVTPGTCGLFSLTALWFYTIQPVSNHILISGMGNRVIRESNSG